MFSPIAATAIFVLMFILIVWDKVERHIITLLCGLLTVAVVFGFGMQSADAIWETINVAQIVRPEFWMHGVESEAGINWATIIFIAGMMIMVEGMTKAGFFRWLCLEIAKLVKFRATHIFVMFMLLSAVLAMFIDSITVILFLAACTIELAQMLKFNPVPVVMAEIFCANLGGSATMCGDPPNIIIGTALGYSFSDFLMNTGLIAAVALVVSVAYFYALFHKKLKTDPNIDISHLHLDVDSVITSKRDFILNTIIFLIAVVLLVTHAQTGLTVATIGVIISALTLIVAGKRAWTLVKEIDYKTLLFFVGLFVVVGGLEQTGVLKMLADIIGKVSCGNPYIMIAIIIWGSGIFSALVDNIPFAAAMIPVISNLAGATGTSLDTLSWSLALGTDIGGSATPIGASANVVGISVATKEGYKISWGEFCKANIPATVATLIIATVIIFLRYL